MLTTYFEMVFKNAKLFHTHTMLTEIILKSNYLDHQHWMTKSMAGIMIECVCCPKQATTALCHPSKHKGQCTNPDMKARTPLIISVFDNCITLPILFPTIAYYSYVEHTLTLQKHLHSPKPHLSKSSLKKYQHTHKG